MEFDTEDNYVYLYIHPTENEKLKRKQRK